MSDNQWYNFLPQIEPRIFQISTPSGYWTWFKISFSKNKGLIWIATAYHVISHENEWQLPIKIKHYETWTQYFLKEENRIIITYPEQDLAFILFNPWEELEWDDWASLLIWHTLNTWAQVWWFWFPVVQPNKLCFFSWHISAYLEDLQSYLVDWVAINWVSWWPAFFILEWEIKFFGVISAYIPNKSTWEPLPWLAVVRSVESYKDDLEALKKEDIDSVQKVSEE